MPTYTTENDLYHIKLNQWGLLLSVWAYGVHVSLFSHCAPSLYKQRKNGYKFLTYIIVLFALCTAAIGLQVWWFQVAFIDNHYYPGGSNQYLHDHVDAPPNMVITGSYMIINWLVDGLLLYRFNILWGTLRLGERHRFTRIFTICSFVAVIATGCVFFPQIAGLGLNLWTDMSTTPAIVYLALSFSFNTILTLLIVYRILCVRSTLRGHLGKHHGRIYTSLVTLIVESAFLYTVVALISVVACGINSPIQYALLPVLGQLQAIPPLMITHRVVEGKALSSETSASLQSTTQLRFSETKDIESSLSESIKDDSAHPPRQLSAWHDLPPPQLLLIAIHNTQYSAGPACCSQEVSCLKDTENAPFVLLPAVPGKTYVGDALHSRHSSMYQ